MDVNMNEARLVGIERVAAPAEIAEPLRVAQNNLLSELPGAVFAILTLAWIVGSFVALF
jgi:hypothetical protein